MYDRRDDVSDGDSSIVTVPGRSARFDGGVAVVTGAGHGLGAAIARELARDGCAVAVTDVDASAAEALANEIGGGAIALALDVRDRASVERAVAETVARLGEVSVLVNNAGINRVGPSERYPESDWCDVVEINLTGVFRCSQIVGARMLEADGGAIVNLASVQARTGSAGRAAYCATKTGVLGLTRALAVEWAGRGVRVNAVAPGYIATRLTRHAIESGLISERELLDRIPMGELGQAEHVARAVAYLASADAAYVTGTTLEVDGGYVAFGAPGPASRIPTGGGA
jgi:NAD(P)-dependent dehydrogenase (short-subunit alcohol dehydrogenase family)